MPPDALISAKNVPDAFDGWAQPEPAGELTVLPRPPSWIQEVLLLRESRGNAPNFVFRFGDRSPWCQKRFQQLVEPRNNVLNITYTLLRCLKTCSTSLHSTQLYLSLIHI